MALLTLANWLVNAWLISMVVAMAAAVLCALRILGFFEDRSNQTADEKARNADDPWRVKEVVESFRSATYKDWKRKDKDGNIIETEIDKEEALRLLLDHRKRMASLLIAFAAVLAVLTTVAIVSLSSSKGQVSGNPQPGTNAVTATAQSISH